MHGITATGATLTDANMYGADLAGGVDLADANLTGATLTAAVMSNANLTGANLASTALGSAFLDGATLTMVRSGGITGNPTVLPANWVLATSPAGGYLAGPGADFSGQNLMGVNFNPGPGRPSADLAGADFAGATVRGLGGDNLTGANLTGANLRGAGFYGSDLTTADFANADLTGANLAVTTLTGAKFAGANLTGVAAWGLTGTPVSLPTHWALRDSCLIGPGAVLPRASLYHANLSGTDLAGANLANAYMGTSNLTGASLRGSDLSGADLSGAILTRADLTAAIMTGTKLSGAIWSHTTCPNGTSSDSYTSGCFSTRLYGFAGFKSPLPGTTLVRARQTVTVTFRLTNATGKAISSRLAARLAATHAVRVTLRGPGIKPANAYCSWNARTQYFSCVIKLPRATRTGKKNGYTITAAENLGTGFLRAPAVAKAVNPETIYFR